MSGLRKGLALAIFISFAVLVVGQQPHYLLNTESSGASKAYTAWDFVSMKPGFHYASQSGSTFNAIIKPGPPSAPTSNTFLSEDGAIASEATLGGVVGAIPGYFDVSGSGAASYTIPIEVTAGIQGMAPSLSFTYNSNGGDGTMGMGWNLNGLSSITRGGGTLFKDRKPYTTNSTWINDSIFYIDGIRLIAKNKVYPSKIYGQTNIGEGLDQLIDRFDGDKWEDFETEYKTYSKISTFGYIPFVSVSGIYYCAVCSAPRTFQFTSKNGQVSIYQASRDSAYITDVEDLNVEWLLAYTSDPQGNFVRYHYQSVGKQTVIKKIEYTGNNQKEPFDSVVFVYDKKVRTDKYFISDAALENRLLLKSVKAYSSNVILRQYNLDYSKVGPKYYLKSVALEGLDNTHYRRTMISWGANYDDLSVQTTALPTVSSNNPVQISDRSWYAADMNGDGIDDVINIYPTPTVLPGGMVINRDLAQVFTSTQSSGNITLTPDSCYDLERPTVDYSGIPESKVLFGDINGDGKMEMLIPKVNTIEMTLTVTVLGIGTFIRNLGEASPRPIFGIGDLNKDGKDDFVYMESDPRSDGNYIGGVYFFTQNTSGNWALINQSTKPRRILISDVNNDALNDILMVGATKLNVILNDDENPYVSRFQNNTIFSYLPNAVCKQGDFNGDGSPDFLMQSSADSTWHVYLNKGSLKMQDVSLSNFLTIRDAVEDSVRYEENCMVLDFNKDGKSDVVMVDDEYNSNNIYLQTRITWYASNGNGFDQIKQFTTSDQNYTFNNYRCVGDYNGDGRQDLLSCGSDLHSGPVTGKMIYITNSYDPTFGANLVSSITDGMGNSTRITYRPLTNTLTSSGKQFYSKGTSTTYPNIDVQASLYCVEKVSSSNGVGCEISTNFSYSEAIANLTGKGFLGFKQIQRINELKGQKSIANIAWNMQCFVPDVRTSEIWTIDGTLLSKNETRFENFKSDSFIVSRMIKESNANLQNMLSQTKEIALFDDYGNPLQTITKMGGMTTMQDVRYNAKGALYPCRPDSIVTTSDLGNETYRRRSSIYYDNIGRIIKSVQDPGDPNQISIEYKSFNTFGLPTRIETTSNGIAKVELCTYSNSDRFINSQTDALGQTTTFVWDESIGRLTSSTNRIGTTTYHYDGLGRLWKTDYPDGTTSTDVLQWASQNNFSAKYYRYQAVTGSAPVYNWYDNLGREVVSETYLLGGTKSRTFTEYLTSGQLNRVSRPTFADLPEAWDATYSYYADGRINSISTPHGITSYTYNGATTTQITPKGTVVVTLNDFGKTSVSTTNGKAVTFAYYASGLVKSATPQGSPAVTMEYDLQGNRIKLTDPDVGISTSRYNGFGQPIWEKIINNSLQGEITTSYAYQPNGQLDTLNRNGEVTKYEYDNFHRINSVTIAGKHKQSFGYDTFDRDTCLVEELDGRVYRKSFVYDAIGRLASTTYPSGYKTINNYDAYGNLTGVTDPQNRNILKLLGMNARGQSTKVSRGTKETAFGYDVSKGMLISMATPGVSSYTFTYDGVTNNLSGRKDILTSQEYRFTYDSQDRLTDWNILQNGIQTQANGQAYDVAGNIQSRTDLGSMTMNYGVNGKPHALASISGTPSAIPLDSLGVTYTDFRKIATLREGTKAYEIAYGVDNQRRKSIYRVGGVTKLTRYYLGDYEEEISPSGNVRKIHYLSGGAMLVRNNGVDSLLFAYCDNQGSLTALTNDAGTVIEHYAYDPWGRRLNPDDWKSADTRTSWLTSRGYTGHEHLDVFGIINMNGRVYDPATAMFLSPDPFVQEPGNWADYNRYGYCMNNPTNATDPSGYILCCIEQWTIFDRSILYASDRIQYDSDGRGFGETSSGYLNDVNLNNTYYDWDTGNYRDIFSQKNVSIDGVSRALYNFGKSFSLGNYDTYFQFITAIGNGQFSVTAVPGNKATGANLKNFTMASAWSENAIVNFYTQEGVVGSDIWNSVSNTLGAVDFVLGGLSNSTGIALSRTMAYVSTASKVRPTEVMVKVPVGSVYLSTKIVSKTASFLKIGGVITGVAGALMTVSEIRSGEKELYGEGGLDLIMGGVAFVPGGGWLVSGAYFGGKALLEYSGNDFWN